MKEIQLTQGKVALVDDAEEQAARARDVEMAKLYGEFARLNFS
jgi:hypothetical protein